MSVEMFTEIREAARPLVGREATKALQRAMQHTLSQDVLGLTEPTTLREILREQAQLRPIVSSARTVPLSSGKLRYPRPTQKPTAIKQVTEKTEGGTAKMEADDVEVDADTFVASGDLSWQAARWATPDALELWMTLASQAYARTTETAAAAALVAGVTATESVGGTDLAAWLAAITTAASDIQLSSDFLADVIYADPVSAASLSALVFAESPAGTGTVAGLRLVSSNGLVPSAPTVIVGYSQALLCAETEGAPIELRAVEPAIGGIEVGVIGAFAASVAEPHAFVTLTPPS